MNNHSNFYILSNTKNLTSFKICDNFPANQLANVAPNIGLKNCKESKPPDEMKCRELVNKGEVW